MLENTFRIRYLGKELCAEFGQLGIMRLTFRIERINDPITNPMNINDKLLLPVSTDDYMDWNQALDMSRLSEDKLEELCNEGIIERITNGKAWHVKKSSLEEYIQDQKTE